MKRSLAVAALVLLGACNAATPAEPVGDPTAMAAAEKQAVDDTDAALRESRDASPGTIVADDRSSR